MNIRHLNSAFFDGNEKKLQKCFDLLSKSYKERFKVYILIDISNKSPFPDQLRIRSDIFKNETSYKIDMPACRLCVKISASHRRGLNE